MLVTGIAEVTEEDVNKHRFEVFGSEMVRFCIDVRHDIIGFCAPQEDHVIGALTLLSTEKDIESLDEEHATQEFCDHIVGGTLYPGDGQAQLVSSGTSVEQQLRLFKLSHSTETVQKATDKAVALFQRFFPKLTFKIIPMPPSL